MKKTESQTSFPFFKLYLSLTFFFIYFIDQLLQKHPPTPKPHLLKLDAKIQLLIPAVVHKVWKFCRMTSDLWLYQRPQHLPGIKMKYVCKICKKSSNIFRYSKLKVRLSQNDFMNKEVCNGGVACSLLKLDGYKASSKVGNSSWPVSI